MDKRGNKVQEVVLDDDNNSETSEINEECLDENEEGCIALSQANKESESDSNIASRTSEAEGNESDSEDDDETLMSAAIDDLLSDQLAVLSGVVV